MKKWIPIAVTIVMTTLSCGESTKPGNEFGKTATESQCVTEALAGYAKRRKVTRAINQGVFLAGCLDASKVEADFCTNVPPKDPETVSRAWRESQCNKAGIAGDLRCRSILDKVQNYCVGDVRKQKLATAR